MTPREVLAFIREREVKAVDLRLMDFPGLWKHFTIPAEMLTEESFEDGIGFDASGFRGWMKINESDMIVVPQPDTLFLDPFRGQVTLAILCKVQDPLTREDYSKDPRNVAEKAVNHLKHTGVADAAQFGPSLEFFVFDDVRYDQTARSGYYYLDSTEAAWNTGRDEGPEPGQQGAVPPGLLPVPADRPPARRAVGHDAGDDRVRADGSRATTTRRPRPASARSTSGTPTW